MFKKIKALAKGKFAEVTTNIAFDIAIDKEIYKLHKNVTLEIKNDTTQIDHIIISEYGIFVIETKNYKGWIFGREKDKKWTQKLYKKSYSFQNPLHQNYKHIKFLQEVLSIKGALELKESDFISIIHFAGENVELKTKLPKNVMKNGVLPFIKEHKDIKLSKIKIKHLNQRLSNKRLKPGLETNYKHIKNAKEHKQVRLR